jgi:hypothetical protein
MEDFYGFIFDSPNGSEKKKDDPEKMDQHHTICKNLVCHFLELTPNLFLLKALFFLTNLYWGGRGSFLFGHLEKDDCSNHSDAPQHL